MEELNEIIGDKYVIKLIESPIDVNEAIDSVNDSKCGAVSVFMGNTRRTERGDTSGRQVLHLYYESYKPMALKEMKTIVEQHLNTYTNEQIHRCFIAHRLGEVSVGQTSIVIACSSPHRTEAHELVLKLLNRIKAFVPIWKKIEYKTTEDTTTHTSSEWSDKSDAFWLKTNQK